MGPDGEAGAPAFDRRSLLHGVGALAATAVTLGGTRGTSSATTVTVAKGETLVAIARRTNTNVRGWLRANPSISHPDKLVAGAKLVVPSAPRYPTSKALQASKWSLVARKGDTLGKLAERAGVPPADLAALNGLDGGAVVRPGDRLLVPHWRKVELATLTLPGGYLLWVAARVATRVDDMACYAALDGVSFKGARGHRSAADQVRLRKMNGCPDLYDAPGSSCGVPTLPPGKSKHESGLAIDVPAAEDTASATYRWLAANAKRFGFRRIASESWHWETD